MISLLLTAVQLACAVCVVVAMAAMPARAQTIDPAPVAAMTQPQSEHKRLTWEERFARANTSHDGKLTLDQARTGYRTVARQFDEIDRGQKGYVTEQDMRAWRDANREKRRTHKEAAQDPLRPRKAYQRTQSDQSGAMTTQVIGPQAPTPAE